MQKDNARIRNTNARLLRQGLERLFVAHGGLAESVEIQEIATPEVREIDGVNFYPFQRSIVLKHHPQLYENGHCESCSALHESLQAGWLSYANSARKRFPGFVGELLHEPNGDYRFTLRHRDAVAALDIVNHALEREGLEPAQLTGRGR